ncbi:hypothetical protein QA648_04045 [Rhizobium sp. CB3171]|uniref:hypothetical protein n=1 Tax=Rhizobium sp. CB3171 TaxID=3039157 RepID=UPI0024B14B9F|nr:hypothetical protein [Rhizobium sp. CB3171]WFU02961.1 hypothetical protein QA648_04045 [Rhizobium sp. CB3171]
MWSVFKALLSGIKPFNVMAGDVIFATAWESGTSRFSFFEWRVKELLDKSDVLIGVKMRPDSYAGPEGDVKNYINFDIETAIRIRDSLNECIEFARHYREIGGKASYAPTPNVGETA